MINGGRWREWEKFQKYLKKEKGLRKSFNHESPLYNYFTDDLASRALGHFGIGEDNLVSAFSGWPDFVQILLDFDFFLIEFKPKSGHSWAFSCVWRKEIPQALLCNGPRVGIRVTRFRDICDQA